MLLIRWSEKKNQKLNNDIPAKITYKMAWPNGQNEQKGMLDIRRYRYIFLSAIW